MDEVISRQAAIDIAEEFLDSQSNGADVAMDIISRLVALDTPQQWHRITCRPMDEEERKYWSELRGYTLEDDEAVIYSGCPDDGDEVLVCTASGNVYIDTFYNDPEYGCYFEGNGEMDGIVAWMPKPEPYKAERSGE